MKKIFCLVVSLGLILSVFAAEAPAAGSGATVQDVRRLDDEGILPIVSTGEREMKALASAYPDRIAEVAYRDDDWALRIEDRWYYWAMGRVLPEADRKKWRDFTGLRFYPYPRGLPPLRVLDEEAKERLQERLRAAEENPPRRNETFLSHLFEAAGREETESRLVRTALMGFPVRLHRRAAEKLDLVEGDLRALAETDRDVRRFFAGISHIGGYHFRSIAGTASRSYHGYGLALDLIAKDWGGKQY